MIPFTSDPDHKNCPVLPVYTYHDILGICMLTLGLVVSNVRYQTCPSTCPFPRLVNVACIVLTPSPGVISMVASADVFIVPQKVPWVSPPNTNPAGSVA